MPILLGHLQISPDDIHSMEDARKLVGSLPRRVTVLCDVEHYPPGVLEFLLVHVVRPAIALGAEFERAHFLVHPKTPFPAHLLAPVPTLPDALREQVVAAGRKLMARKAAAPSPADQGATITATDALWLDLRGISSETLRAFETWLRDEEMFPMAGTTHSGPARISPGLYSGTHSFFSAAFYASDADAILAWLRAAGLPVSRVASPPPPDSPVCHEPGCSDPPIEESDFCGKHQD